MINDFFYKAQSLWIWLCANKEWIFSGIGIVLFPFIIAFFKKFLPSSNKRKLAVRTSLALRLEQDVINDVVIKNSPVYPVLTFEITNISEPEVFIKDISFYLCGKKINYNGFSNVPELASIDLRDPKKYQKKLNHGEIMKGDFNIAFFALAEIKSQLKPCNKIRLKVLDTLGGKYYSEKYKYSEFLNVIKQAIEANQL